MRYEGNIHYDDIHKCAEKITFKVPCVDFFIAFHAAVGKQGAVDLSGADIDGKNFFCALLEKAVGEAADIKCDKTGDIDGEAVKRRFELESAA